MGNHNNITIFLSDENKISLHFHRSKLTELDIVNFLNENEFCNPGCLLSKLMELETPFLIWAGSTFENHPLICGDEYEIKMINNKIYINHGDFTGTPKELIDYIQN